MIRVSCGIALAVTALALRPAAGAAPGDAALTLRATVKAAKPETFAITLYRWPTDAERAPLLTALSAPTPSAPPAAASGRGSPPARGGRGAAPPAAQTPQSRLSAAIKAAPTVGYIWRDGVTGYSIKSAWRLPAANGGERIVLVTDRRLDAHAPEWARGSTARADGDFTVIELRLDERSAGEGKTSLTTLVVVDPASQTLVLADYAAATPLLEVKR
jgi:hypothetical protein